MTITLTEQELVAVFAAGVKQGNDEATAHDWGSRPDTTAQQALLDALQELLYERRKAAHVQAGTEVWPTGAQWPDELEVRAEFDLRVV
jgi:hypothetical protein